ncbi:ABC transporter ATP-binding protein [Hyphomicrobium sp.]|uniref:ABC transporter ATP-binding protein n=1 Tax=Hyphomicrobium sp. TaxID=82 RepID=UPI002FE1DC61
MAYIHFDAVTIDYPILNAGSMSLRKELVAISTGGKFLREPGAKVTVRALDSISFHIADGERVGITGHNGSGKTTLLRTMAGIFYPNVGTVTVEGRISTLFQLGAGMDPELTGYDNIIRMAILNGASFAEAERAIPDIESFTELGQFLSVPVRTYSAGMMTRLLFAVSTAIHPQILLIDEIIGAGDTSFQERARKRITAFMEQASIVVIASHSADLLSSFCRRRLRLEHGKLLEE